MENNAIVVTRHSEEKEDKSLHGLSRALIANMVEGVTNGYSKTLEVVGVGYKVAKQGKTLQLYLGHSLMPGSGLPQARFCMTEEDGITFDVPDSNTIIVKGIVPYVSSWKKPITIARHAYGDIYKASETLVPVGSKAQICVTLPDGSEKRVDLHTFECDGIVQEVYNLDDSIRAKLLR